MDRIRIFVADDSAVDRLLIERMLGREPDLEVVGLGADGYAALEAAEAGAMEALVLDVEMPGIDGLETLERLRATRPDLAVALFTARPDRITARRASRLYGRPVEVFSKLGEGAGAIQTIGAALVPWLREAVAGMGREGATSPRTSCDGSTARGRPRRSRRSEVRLVVLGSSTGGPNAVADVLCALPEDLPVPICVTQHMPEGFTSAFAERLDRTCRFTVREAVGGDLLLPSTVWIAPGGRHMEVGYDGPRLVTRLTDGPLENSCRPAVDPLFRSAANALGDGALAVILTGMGRDGLEGARALKGRGATVLVQDEETSVVWGMPGAVADAGLADQVLPLGEVASAVTRTVIARARRRRSA